MIKKHCVGFYLIELLVTLTIVGILYTLGMPLYEHHLARAHRLAAANELTKLAVTLEHHFIEKNTYADVAIPPSTLHDYQLRVLSADSSYYMIAAQPLARQAALDAECGTLTLNSLGEKSISGSAKIEMCW